MTPITADAAAAASSDLAENPLARTTEPAVVLRNVEVEYFGNRRDSGERVLQGVSLTCEPGELLVLVGRSGCGKTTILNVIAGLVEPTEGDCVVLGRAPRASRHEFGYMFARDALMPWRTVRRNVEIGLELRGVPRDQRRSRASEYLERVGLAHAESRYPWQLSQGMRQRAALARTWAMEPSLLLMDEPFAALDAQTREVVRNDFLGAWESFHTSAVFVTHDLEEALLVGDRVLVISQGGVAAEVPVPFPRPRRHRELRRSPQFREQCDLLESLLENE